LGLVANASLLKNRGAVPSLLEQKSQIKPGAGAGIYKTELGFIPAQ